MAHQMNPSNLPASPPPPGVIPNFDNPETRVIHAHIGMGICLALASVIVVLRIYVKLAITHLWGWDDWACVMALALVAAQEGVAFSLMTPRTGLGTHNWNIRLTTITKSFIQRTITSVNLYTVSAFFVKLSLFLLYLRLFKPNKLTRWLTYGGIFICALFYSASIISFCVLSIPNPGQPDDITTWASLSRENSIPIRHLGVVQSVFGTLSDVYLLTIPIQSIFMLHLPLERKVGVSAIFMTGIIAIVCSVGNLVYRVKLVSTEDITWLSVPAYIFSSAEMSAGIICGCLPILPPLFRGHAPKKFHFPSFGYFSSRFTSHNSRRPFISDKTRSMENSNLTKPDSSLEQEAAHYIELEKGTRSNKTVLVSRAF